MPKYLDSLSVSHEPNLINALEWCDIANVLRIQLERQDVNYFLLLYGSMQWFTE